MNEGRRYGFLASVGMVFVVACASGGDELTSTAVRPNADAGRRDAGPSPSTDSGWEPTLDAAVADTDGGSAAPDAAVGPDASLDGSVSAADASWVDATTSSDGGGSTVDAAVDGGADASFVVDAGAATDSGSAADAARDASPGAVDSGSGLDAGRDAGAPVCAPPSTTPAFTAPTAWPPSAPWAQARCTSTGVQNFLDACVGPFASVSACNAWKSAASNAACGACLLTPKTAASVGPFVTNAAVTPSVDNPAGFDPDWVRGLLSTCLDHFQPGCGTAYLSFANCTNAACDTRAGGNCASASSARVAVCREDAYGSGNGVCGALGTTALGASGACGVAFYADAGTRRNGDDCFSRGTAGGEDTSTYSGIETYLRRVALSFCGP